MREVPLARRLSFVAACVVAVAGCSSVTHEPPNLSPHKRQIRAYVESGQYMRDLDTVAVRASAWIEQRAARGGNRLTVVFDLDETLLFNWPHISAMDFGYVVAEWNRWVDDAKAPAIEPVREVYRTARRLGVEVVFITGRPEAQREGTERNLRAIECGDFAKLICKPPGHRGGTVAYKSTAREQLIRDGWTIIANIGDQHSDLEGGAAERTFKLPNVFYQLD
jgi:acid phosphatase